MANEMILFANVFGCRVEKAEWKSRQITSHDLRLRGTTLRAAGAVIQVTGKNYDTRTRAKFSCRIGRTAVVVGVGDKGDEHSGLERKKYRGSRSADFVLGPFSRRKNEPR